MSEHQDQSSKEVARPSPNRLRSLGFAAAAAALGVAAWGVFSREQHAADPELVLPGDIQAWYSAPVYARVNGYLKMWYFDYGARIKKGQVLAEIETPEIDAQFSAAKARLRSAEAVIKGGEE